MRNKLLKFSLILGVFAVALIVTAAVAGFAFTISTTPVQAQEAAVEAAPLEIEPVSHQPEIVEPVSRYEYAGYSGDCSFHKQTVKQQMVEAPSKQVDNQLLSLAE